MKAQIAGEVMAEQYTKGKEQVDKRGWRGVNALSCRLGLEEGTVTSIPSSDRQTDIDFPGCKPS